MNTTISKIFWSGIFTLLILFNIFLIILQFGLKIDKFLRVHSKWQKNKKGLTNAYNMLTSQFYATNTWHDIPTRFFREFRSCPGDWKLKWKGRGYSTIFDIMMKRFPNPKEELPVMSNTVLNAEVSLIDYSDPNEKVRVKTKDGETYFADHVIVTCSLGVLKDKHKYLFKPNLPEEKQKIIQEMNFDSAVKIFLSFDEPWWPTDVHSIYFIWKDEDLEMIKKDKERSWLQGLIGFYTPEERSNILYAIIGGQPSRNMEKLTDEQVKKCCIEVLQRFCGKIYKVTNPTEMIRSMWHSNKNFSGACYSGSLKSDPETVNPKKMAEPVGEGKPVILFAGEATSPDRYSVVDGAIESGWREADRIIHLYPDEKKH